MQEEPKQIESNLESQTDDLLKLHQEEYISFCAIGGILTADDGTITTMTQRELAMQWNVHPNTLTNWKKSIPNFTERVRARRKELFSLGRETALWNRLYVIARGKEAAPAVSAAKLLLGHFSELQLPVQRADVKVQNSLADIFSNATKTIVEGEVVDNGYLNPPGSP